MKGKFLLRNYQKGDSKSFKPKALFGPDITVLHQRLDAMAELPQALIFSCIAGDKTIAVIGASPIYPGVMDLWSLMSDDIKKHPVAFCKAVKFAMAQTQIGLNVHRFQMAIRCDFKSLTRWARFLEMQEEGILRKFGPDKSDHYLYARVY